MPMYRNYISHPSRVWRNTSHYSLIHGIICLDLASRTEEGPERPAALPRWRRESRPETPSAESPWDGYAEDPDGRRAGGTPPARLEREPVEAAAAMAPVEASQEPPQ